jgi:TPR repeat protein
MRVILAVLLLLFSTAALAGPVEDLAVGAAAYERGDFAEAAIWFRKSANAGNATAQDSLGVMHVNGEGVPQDYVRAYAWFNIAETNVPTADGGWHARLNRFRNEIAGQMSAADMAAVPRVMGELQSQLGP